MSSRAKRRSIYLLLLAVAFGFRLFVVLRLPNDTPDDGRVYAQIARNVLEQRVYSHDSEAPYVPSLIRLPGYPLFLTALYAVFGHGNNTAVRIAQAVIDTATCVLIALLAFQWAPDSTRKHATAIGALALAAVCPFTTIYAATILTEVPTNFLAVAMCLVATFAFNATSRRRGMLLWVLTGLLAGVAVLFRPDSGLFAAAIGITILLSAVLRRVERSQERIVRRVGKSVLVAAVFSMAFCLVLVPWTIRNQRVFHLFQPLSPTHGEMPGEFVPRGYLMWLRTWLDDGRYVGPVLWQLDTAAIEINAFPSRAFDSREERDRVAALLEKYNRPPDEPEAVVQSETNAAPVPPASGTPPAGPNAEPSPADEEEEEEEPEEGSEEENPGEFGGEMTPEIDAGFAQLARERIAHAPLRYYLLLPLKRAGALWFDTHSQYYPFEGEILPLENMDYSIHQQYWLPLFATMTWIYSVLGVIGAGLLWRSGNPAGRRWAILAALVVFIRLGFFATLENPEPRYTVEIFPFLSILGGIAIGEVVGRLKFFKQVSGKVESED